MIGVVSIKILFRFYLLQYSLSPDDERTKHKTSTAHSQSQPKLDTNKVFIYLQHISHSIIYYDAFYNTAFI